MNLNVRYLRLLNKLYYELPYFRGKDDLIRFCGRPLAKYRGELKTIQGFTWSIEDNDTFWTYIKSCERFAISTFARLVSSGFQFIDIGANRGFYSLTALACSRSIIVHTFEVNPTTATQLNHNLSQFSGREIKQFNLALGNSNGTTTLYSYDGLGSGADTLFPLDKYGKTFSFDVPIRTLDSIYTDVAPVGLSILKIDVEGGELEIILGGNSFIAKVQPIIFMEINCKMLMHSGGPERIFQHLANFHYSLFWINEKGYFTPWKNPKSLPHLQKFGENFSANYLCLPKKLSIEKLNLR